MAPKVQLEAAAQAFVDATATSPLLSGPDYIKGRTALDEIQSSPVVKLPVTIEDLYIQGGPGGQVAIRILKPLNAPPTLPVIVYIHGAGWVFGNSHTHDRLIRELSVRAGAAVVFPNYSRSPEVRYPTALEECYAVTKWAAGPGAVKRGLNAERLVIAGDGVGGNMAAAITLLAKERGGPIINSQLLFYPVMDASLDTESYQQFAEGYYLRRAAMKWFWDQYTANLLERNEITASPLRASFAELKTLPQALIITAEADVVRDEGEAYAGKLRQAGVHVTAVRFQGIIHDFVMLSPLANTAATRAAMTLATGWLRDSFES